MKKAILMFDGTDYDWLSNFYPARIEIDGENYYHSEGYYQSMKPTSPDNQERIRNMKDPGDAKAAGQKVVLREGWNDIKYLVMLRAVRAKFQQHPELAQRLINTGDTLLVEGTYWHDQTWGIYNWRGANWLGRILMRVRNELYEDVVGRFTGNEKGNAIVIATGLDTALRSGTLPSETYIEQAQKELDIQSYLATRVDLSPRR